MNRTKYFTLHHLTFETEVMPLRHQDITWQRAAVTCQLSFFNLKTEPYCEDAEWPDSQNLSVILRISRETPNRSFDHSEWLSFGSLLIFSPLHAECRASCLSYQLPDLLVTTFPPQSFSCPSSTCPLEQISSPTIHPDRPNWGNTISASPLLGSWLKCPLQ